MEKRIYILLTMLFLGITFSLSAQTAFEGFTLVQERTAGNQYIYELKDAADIPVTVVTRAQVTAAQKASLLDIRNRFSSWKSLTIASLRVFFQEDKIEVLMVPESLIWKGTELIEYLPSGILFSITDIIEYNFRMVKDNLFLRLQGRFFNEDQFCDRLLEASNNPLAFIQAQDPEYVIRRLSAIEANIDLVNDAAAALQKANEDLNTRLEEMTAKYNDLQGRHEALQQKHSALQEKHDALKAEKDSLDKAFQILRYAVMTLENTGFFRGPTTIPPEYVERVVKLKRENPSLTIKHSFQQVKAECLKMSDQDVMLIFSVYFNEFK